MIKLIIFLLLSIPLLFISWRTFFKINNHGLYRFLAWECILWLLINNISYWIRNPFSIHQIFSWLFLILSLYFVIAGFLLMKQSGRQINNREGEALYTFEKTSHLIQTGIFKYIRHPMYSSLIFFTWGVFLKNPTVGLLVVSCFSTLFLYVTAKLEEFENIDFFGREYIDYKKRSKMFVPFLF